MCARSTHFLQTKRVFLATSEEFNARMDRKIARIKRVLVSVLVISEEIQCISIHLGLIKANARYNHVLAISMLVMTGFYCIVYSILYSTLYILVAWGGVKATKYIGKKLEGLF